VTLLRQGRAEEAVPALRKALRFCPGLIWSRASLAAALRSLGRLDEALAEAEAASQARPDLALTWLSLAETRLVRGEFDATLAATLSALKIDPAHAEAYRILAAALEGQGFAVESLADCGRALAEHLAAQSIPEPERQARLRDYHLNLAGLCVQWGQHAGAEQHYRAALAIDPECDEARSGMLFAANYRPDLAPLAARADAEREAETMRRRRSQCGFDTHDRDPERPLRIGLVSGDFGRHPVGYFLAGPLAEIDPGQFILHAYSTLVRNDRQTGVLRASIPHWRDVDTLDDDALIERIRADRIDILIDLAGHTLHNRMAVFAARAAPVQVTWLGYFATTGLAAMDWILADPQVLPPAEEAHFCERPWRLPDSYYCFAPPTDAIEVAPPPSSRGAPFTFGCFNNPAKLNERVIALWSRILAGLPGARLLLKYRHYRNPDFVAAMRARFATHGIDAERLEFEGETLRPEYLRAFDRVDVALDPFPYPGGTTTVDGLWMGVPALTLKGDRFIAHQGETILTSAGLADWIARDAEEYVARAIAAARDIDHLTALRASLRPQILASPLCDAPRFARNLEAAWRGMWRRWCAEREANHEGNAE